MGLVFDHRVVGGPGERGSYCPPGPSVAAVQSPSSSPGRGPPAPAHCCGRVDVLVVDARQRAQFGPPDRTHRRVPAWRDRGTHATDSTCVLLLPGQMVLPRSAMADKKI